MGVSVCWLFYYTLALVAVLATVFLHHLFRCVGVAIDAEVAAGVVHADVFAHHAAA